MDLDLPIIIVSTIIIAILLIWALFALGGLA